MPLLHTGATCLNMHWKLHADPWQTQQSCHAVGSIFERITRTILSCCLGMSFQSQCQLHPCFKVFLKEASRKYVILFPELMHKLTVSICILFTCKSLNTSRPEKMDCDHRVVLCLDRCISYQPDYWDHFLLS